MDPIIKLENLLTKNAEVDSLIIYNEIKIYFHGKTKENANLMANLKRYNIRVEKETNKQYILRASDGTSRDIIMDYIWRHN